MWCQARSWRPSIQRTGDTLVNPRGAIALSLRIAKPSLIVEQYHTVAAAVKGAHLPVKNTGLGRYPQACFVVEGRDERL